MVTKKRSYGDACGIARALDLVGERWSLMIVRELLLGPKRFTDIRTGLPHLGPDVLAQRLRELEAAGLVRKRTLPPPAASQVYELTERGLELEPIILELGRWGSKLPMPPPEMSMSSDSYILALRTLFDPERAGDLDAQVSLLVDGSPFHAEVHGGTFTVERGESPTADAVLTTDPATLIALIHDQLPFAEALRGGVLRVRGDKAVARRFVRLFPLPHPGLAAG